MQQTSDSGVAQRFRGSRQPTRARAGAKGVSPAAAGSKLQLLAAAACTLQGEEPPPAAAWVRFSTYCGARVIPERRHAAEGRVFPKSARERRRGKERRREGWWCTARSGAPGRGAANTNVWWEGTGGWWWCMPATLGHLSCRFSADGKLFWRTQRRIQTGRWCWRPPRGGERLRRARVDTDPQRTSACICS